ncbi:MAG: hypothetical protein AAGF98_17125 [Cyanobacteria bacterium P01_H01_bin.153]
MVAAAIYPPDRQAAVKDSGGAIAPPIDIDLPMPRAIQPSC